MRVRTAAAVITVGACLLLLPRDTSAHHFWFLVDNPERNNGGMTTDYGHLWGGNIAWIHQGKALGVCNDWGPGNYFAMPQGIRDAIASWEGVLVNTTEFSQGCGFTGYGLNFVRSSVTGGFPCVSYAYGCAWFSSYPPPYDSVRKAHYPHSLNVWFNNTTYTDWNDNGYKAVAAHELGHVFGLDEQYLGAPNHGSCPSPYVIVQGLDCACELIPLTFGDFIHVKPPGAHEAQP